MRINTAGTRHVLENRGESLWFFKEWETFLEFAGLTKLDDFLHLTGKEVDRNRKTVVYRIILGDDNQVFYIKLHRNYVKRYVKSFFQKIPYSGIELNNMMHYSRAGLDDLDPVAWGWRSGPGGDDSFLLLKELEGYISLQQWLNGEACASREQRRAVSHAVAVMLAKMHDYGLAHIDLFSWHVFVKKLGHGFYAHPIDLERTKIKQNWFGSEWLMRRKQANDLAVLHLTVPWPQISFAERMRFYAEYCRLRGITDRKRPFLKLVLSIARNRGSKKRFRPYGVAAKLRDARGGYLNFMHRKIHQVEKN